jgi:hypothetical protein
MTGWNRRLSRIAARIAARRLSVWDFDDTLVSSSSAVTVEHGNGEITVLDSASFAYFRGTRGDKIDFSDFNNVTRPRIIKKNMDAFKKAASDEETRTVILTARPKGSASAVKKFMDYLGVKNVEVVALASSDPMDKERWIEKEAGDVDEIDFTDDSSKNVEAVATLKGKIKGEVKTANPPHPKDSDYEGEEMGQVFESDSPTSAIVEVKKDKPGLKPSEQERPKSPHLTSPWWRKQTPEFKRQYCEKHEESPYCRSMAARVARYSYENWLGVVDGSGDAEVRKIVPGRDNHNSLFGVARVLHSRNRFFFVPKQGTAYWITNPDEDEKLVADDVLSKCGLAVSRHSDWLHYRAASSRVVDLTKTFDGAALECDGMTRVLHTVLSRHRVPHVVKIGRVEWSGKQFDPHFWIELPDGKVVDYRLRMWFGGQAPHGVFDPERAGVEYDGHTASIPLLNDMVFQILTGRKMEAAKRGDCYQAAGKYMMDHGIGGNLVLVHGEVLGQGPLEGVRFGHAWIEKGSDVLDVSNGKMLTIPKGLYYAIGDIKRTVRYTHKEFLKRVLDTEHWGPWDLVTER